jgi:hypothetical protein
MPQQHVKAYTKDNNENRYRNIKTNLTMHLPDNTRRLHVIYVAIPNTENTEMLCNNNIQILTKLAYEIKQQ